jgi:hypothetical protein
MPKIKLSSLGHTWVLDLDGTILKHNGYKLDGRDTMLDGALDFLRSIPEGDMVVFITSRTLEQKYAAEVLLKEHNIRFEHIIYGAPYGERILVNDRKPSGLNTALAVNVRRDCFDEMQIEIDETL